MLRPPWVACSRSAPCPVCGRGEGKDDWCIYIPGGNAICRRVPSDKPQKSGGWLHRLNRPSILVKPATPRPASSVKPSRRNDLHILARRFATSMFPARLNFLAKTLGLTAESLRRLDVGWCAGEPMHTRSGAMKPIYAWSFPMRDASGAVTGLRMRSMRNDKFAFTGGGGGLFIPRGLAGGRVFLLEGPTDTAAALDMGLNAFGRESCSAGVELVVDLLKKWRFQELVILSQRDEAKFRDKRRPELGVYYPAQDGAELMARRARLFCPIVRIIMPPEGVKDVRLWLHQGGSAADVEREVLRTPARKLKIASIQKLEGAGIQ